MSVRACRECGEEFRPGVVVCSDCGGVVEDRADEAEPARGGGFEAPSLSREDLVAVAEGQEAGDIEPAARRLGEAGVPFAVSGAVHRFRLLVDAQDAARARIALEPEQGDAASEEALTRCPACGAALAHGARECPDCGLGLGTPESGE